MNDSIRLGSIRGIPIGVHWSVLLVAWLLAWSLAAQLFPAAARGLPVATYWLAGIAVAVAFFGSLLAHEFAHAFFAQRAGIKVAGITLWLLGGAAKLESEAETPGHELRIAASGPIVSATLGLLFLLAAVALSGLVAADGTTTPVLALVAEAAAWLARVNLVLAVFNLLPGTPLDGGRIVRAIAWRLGRDRLRASLLAARLGRILGFGLVALGAFELIVGANLGGLWTIVIGLFMTGTAAAERGLELTRVAFAGLRVRDVMAPEPVRVPAGLTVDLFADAVLIRQRQSGALVVDAGGTVMGVAGPAEVAALRPDRRREARVGEILIPLAAIPVVGPDEPLVHAYERVPRLGATAGGTASANPGDAAGLTAPALAALQAGSAYLLVVEDGEIRGIVTPVDLARIVSLRAAAAEGGRSGAPAREPGPS